MPLINTRGAASIKGFGFAGFSPTVPGMPTSVSASATSCSAISVSFTAPACNGGLSIDYYQAVCTSSGTNSATGSSSPISVSGLSPSTSYTFKVHAHNSQGYGSYSSSTGTATTNAARGCQVYVGGTGNYTFTYPTGVSSVSLLAITPGGNGSDGHSYYCCCAGATMYSAGSGSWGGGLAYKNNVTGTGGSSTLPVETGSANAGIPLSCCRRALGVRRPPFTCVYYWVNGSGSVGQFYGTSQNRGCGSRQVGGSGGCAIYKAGGGGAGTAGYTCIAGSSCSISYTGCPGRGGCSRCHPAGHTNTFGGGGGGSSASSSSTQVGGGGGGGVGLYGRGSNGSGGSAGGNGGSGGSGGNSGSSASGLNGGNGGSYGGGGGGGGASSSGVGSKGLGDNGAIRIIWPGNTRTFPTTDVNTP